MSSDHFKASIIDRIMLSYNGNRNQFYLISNKKVRPFLFEQKSPLMLNFVLTRTHDWPPSKTRLKVEVNLSENLFEKYVRIFFLVWSIILIVTLTNMSDNFKPDFFLFLKETFNYNRLKICSKKFLNMLSDKVQRLFSSCFFNIGLLLVLLKIYFCLLYLRK
jgi:hypothetical protein